MSRFFPDDPVTTTLHVGVRAFLLVKWRGKRLQISEWDGPYPHQVCSDL